MVAKVFFRFDHELEGFVVRVLEFVGDYELHGEEGAYPAWAGYTAESLDGMDVERFFNVLFCHHHTACNKRVVVATLPTWFWTAMVGDDGNLRGRPCKIRHTLPGGGDAIWAIARRPSLTGRTRYDLVPVKQGEPKSG